jgi:hypothetical protein
MDCRRLDENGATDPITYRFMISATTKGGGNETTTNDGAVRVSGIIPSKMSFKE